MARVLFHPRGVSLQRRGFPRRTHENRRRDEDSATTVPQRNRKSGLQSGFTVRVTRDGYAVFIFPDKADDWTTKKLWLRRLSASTVDRIVLEFPPLEHPAPVGS